MTAIGNADYVYSRKYKIVHLFKLSITRLLSFTFDDHVLVIMQPLY